MSNPVRDAVLFLRGQINTRLSQALNARDRTPRVVPPPLAEVIGGERSPLALSRLLEGRSNAEREAAVASYLEARGVPFARHRFASSEGSGENFTVEIGSGRRVLLLIAHHDAVPGSPGANDNAAAVGILLTLLERLAVSVPPGLRVRLLFTAAEERGYLGARKYARGANLAELAGVLSLELCGIGDSARGLGRGRPRRRSWGGCARPSTASGSGATRATTSRDASRCSGATTARSRPRACRPTR